MNSDPKKTTILFWLDMADCSIQTKTIFNTIKIKIRLGSFPELKTKPTCIPYLIQAIKYP